MPQSSAPRLAFLLWPRPGNGKRARGHAGAESRQFLGSAPGEADAVDSSRPLTVSSRRPEPWVLTLLSPSRFFSAAARRASTTSGELGSVLRCICCPLDGWKCTVELRPAAAGRKRLPLPRISLFVAGSLTSVALFDKSAGSSLRKANQHHTVLSRRGFPPTPFAPVILLSGRGAVPALGVCAVELRGGAVHSIPLCG